MLAMRTLEFLQMLRERIMLMVVVAIAIAVAIVMSGFRQIVDLSLIVPKARRMEMKL